MLALLADNGGPTRTMALLPGSPAIDAGVAAGATFDQRGKPRTFDDPGVANAATSDGTDIGAFELQPICSLSCPTDISVSNDPGECGAIVNYTEPSGAGCGTVTCDHPSGSFFAVGETTVTCTSPVGPTCSFEVTVTDTEAPVITTNGQTITLWPPNHDYETVNVTELVASASDNCDDSVGVDSVRIASVTSDEPDNSGGEGNTTNDIVIANDCQSVQLRSERMGNGNGRVYTITFEVTDASGNVGTATAKVTTPHSQNGTAAVDDGPSYTVLSGCSNSVNRNPNPLDYAVIFVRQHYRDFLNREPDAAGLAFWTDNITKCNDRARRPVGRSFEQCVDRQRVTTSAAFFLSPEFQYTGGFVYHLYKGGLGRFPRYLEFMRDMQTTAAGIIVGNQLSGAVIEQNKARLAAEFVERAEFEAIYDGLSNRQYVDKLFQMTGVNASPADRQELVNRLNSATETRATVLQKVVDGTLVISENNVQFTTTFGKTFIDREFNNAFVLMEYFGYMRRDPDAPGYEFWFGKLNYYRNYIDAEMVRSFIVSPEYRSRFGQH